MLYIDPTETMLLKLENDSAFQDKFLNVAKQFAEDEEAALFGQDAQAFGLIKSANELFDLTRGNLFPLVPALWPDLIKTGGKSRPFDLRERRFAVHLMEVKIGGTLVVAGSRQIGKSQSFAARHMILARMLPGYRILYIVPFEEHRSTYATKLRQMERGFAWPVEYKGFRNNQLLKEFPGGASLELLKALTSADQSRGKSADELCYDEYQLFDPDLEPEIDQTLKSSAIKYRIYAGTGATINSPLACRYATSSRGFYILPCGCGEEHYLDDPEVCVSLIRKDGLRCSKCSRVLTPRDAFIAHHNKRELEEGNKGIHIPQIAIPEYVEDELQWRDIYRDFVRYDQAKFLQEVLGISTQEGARELTQTDLEKICMFESAGDLQNLARQDGYRFVVSGMDWGGSDYNRAARNKASNTFHAILGVRKDGCVDIIHMRRYAGMGYQEIVDSIVADHLRLKGVAMASDFGAGQAYNYLIRQHPNIRADAHLVFDYSGHAYAPMLNPPSNSQFYNLLMLNRTESISQLFMAIKSDPPRLRCYRWQEAADGLMEFLNLYRVQDESSSGSRRWRYQRHGNRPDDALHAVNFAYTLSRLILGEHLLEDPGVARMISERMRIAFSVPGWSPLSAARKLPNVVSG